MAEIANPARIIAVQEDIVTIEAAETNALPLIKNEVIYVCPQRQTAGYEEKLKAEAPGIFGFHGPVELIDI